MIPVLAPHLSAVASIAMLGWTTYTIPANDTLRRVALFPLVLTPITVTIVSAKDAGPVQLWNIYLGMMFGTQMVFAAFHLLFILREECHADLKAPDKTSITATSPRTGSAHHPSVRSRWEWQSIYRKLRVSIDLVINKRRISHPDQVPYIPAFNRRRGTSYIPSRTQFLLYRTSRFILCYLALDLLTLQDLEDAETKCASGQERIAARLLSGTVSLPEFAEIVGMVIAYGVCGVVSLTGCYDFVSVLAVGPGRLLLGDDVEATYPVAWPPLFGSPGQAYSLRRFWGVFWHQQFRTVLKSVSGVVVHDVLRLPRTPPTQPPNPTTRTLTRTLALALLTRYIRLFIALLFSGILHLNSDRVQGVDPRDSGAVRFFFWQFVGVVIEDFAQAAYAYVVVDSQGRKSELQTKTHSVPSDGSTKGNGRGYAIWVLVRTLGFIWVGVFMVLVAPMWMFPVLRAGQATVLPVSVVRWTVKSGT